MDAAAIAFALLLQVGDAAAVEGFGCARVVYIDRNPGGVQFAWLEFAGQPVNVARVQLLRLRPCGEVRAAR